MARLAQLAIAHAADSNRMNVEGVAIATPSFKVEDRRMVQLRVDHALE